MSLPTEKCTTRGALALEPLVVRSCTTCSFAWLACDGLEGAEGRRDDWDWVWERDMTAGDAEDGDEGV